MGAYSEMSVLVSVRCCWATALLGAWHLAFWHWQALRWQLLDKVYPRNLFSKCTIPNSDCKGAESYLWWKQAAWQFAPVPFCKVFLLVGDVCGGGHTVLCDSACLGGKVSAALMCLPMSGTVCAMQASALLTGRGLNQQTRFKCTASRCLPSGTAS